MLKIKIFLAILIMAFAIPGFVQGQSMDDAGNMTDIDFTKHGQLFSESIGDVNASFPNPASVRGLTFKDGNLWGVTQGRTLYEMNPDSGIVLSTVAIVGNASLTFGLGWDSNRNLFVVTDALLDEIFLVDTGGIIQNSFSAPSLGPVGAAYDSTRDGYWITDFHTNRIHLIDPDTGIEITSLAVPSGASRIAGTGYDPCNDVIMFHSRNSAETYLIRASDGVQVDVFSTPPSPGVNNGQGAAIRPSDQTGYLTNFEVSTIFIVDTELSCAANVSIDIKPQSCPNPLNVRSKGLLPIAILGTTDLDVRDIDIATLEIKGVAPARSVLEDVATPTGLEPCGCLELIGGDGTEDLVLKFKIQEIVDILPAVQNGEEIQLTLTGELTDGTAIEGSDCVVIKGVK